MADEELKVYVLQMQKQGVMIPADAVAEIIPYEPLQRIEDAPDWFIGLLGWRGIQIPVISFEIMSVERASFSLVSVASASLVVMRGIADQKKMPFYAIVSQTFPAEHNINPELIIETGEETEKTEVCRVRFRNEMLAIPDVEFLENALLEIVEPV